MKPGSSVYYSLLHTNKALRENIILYRSIYEKLKKIKPVAVSWWEQELQTKPELLPILQTFAEHISTNIFADESSLLHFYKNTAGALEKSLGKFYGVTDPETLSHLEQLGIFIERINHLRDCKKYIAQGKCYFSGEQLLKHHLTLHDLCQLQFTPNIRALFEDETTHNLSTFAPLKHKKIRPTLILANIQKTLLAEIQQSDFPVFTHHIGLTPLRKWWIAIRS